MNLATHFFKARCQSLIAALLCVSFAACVEQTVSDGGEGAGSNGTALFWVKTHTVWESTESDDDTSAWNLQKTCEVPAGTAPGTIIDCDVIIPEGELFFSRLLFTAGGYGGLTSCARVIYQPYFYQLSDSAAFVNPFIEDATAVDCSGLFPNVADCYNGAATTIEDFPKFSGRYMLGDDEGAKKKGFFQFDSVESGSQMSRRNNRWTSNSLANRTISNATNDRFGYVGNSMIDWSLECRDKWDDIVYGIRINLYDQDTDGSDDPGGALDHRSDWESTHP